MSTRPHAARASLLFALLSITLAACANLGAPQQPTNPPGPAGQPAGVASYPGPGVAATVTAIQAQPTVDTAQTPQTQPTADAAQTPQGIPTPDTVVGSLLGPEWTVAYSGDLNRDGRPDAVGWAPAPGMMPGQTFRQPMYTNYAGPASQVVIVQAGPDNRPQIQFLATTTRLTAGSTVLYNFDASRAPAAFMVRVTAAGPTLLDVVQVDGAGEPIAQGIGIRWVDGAYRLSAGPGK
ncbi:MAG: hypothetical protein DIU80_005565 [Chloroflexota bacterium]|nr:MAG: hypothetical protein DIU80_00610 [Chloroflexota bacterium]